MCSISPNPLWVWDNQWKRTGQRHRQRKRSMICYKLWSRNRDPPPPPPTHTHTHTNNATIKHQLPHNKKYIKHNPDCKLSSTSISNLSFMWVTRLFVSFLSLPACKKTVSLSVCCFEKGDLQKRKEKRKKERNHYSFIFRVTWASCEWWDYLFHFFHCLLVKNCFLVCLLFEKGDLQQQKIIIVSSHYN